MRSEAGRLARVHHENMGHTIQEARSHRRRDDERRTIASATQQRLVNALFALRINCRSRFIQYQNGWVAQQGSGQRNTLSLSTR